MRKMGGLAKRIPITYWTMVMGWLAICGVPGFSGFFSKDEILGYAAGYPQVGMLLYTLGLLTAALTAFYMSRLMWKTFWTNPRFNEAERAGHGHSGGHGASHSAHSDVPGDAHAEHGHGGVHESPPSMWVVLVILAVLSVIGGYIGLPGNNLFEKFLEPAVASYDIHHGVPISAGMLLGTIAAAVGIGLAWNFYSKRRETGELLTPEQKAVNPLYQGSLNLWYVDGFFYRVFVTWGGAVGTVIWRWIDQGLIDGLVNALAAITAFLSQAFRRVQTGYVRAYALSMLIGVIAVVIGLLWGALKH
ncbi:MAG TPA: proton-conducting transporter membrane subunit, partial [Chthonomonadales bacterium]|nr:proton-conducting transporter membrane subunit [Chthonomonadales bacterium]